MWFPSLHRARSHTTHAVNRTVMSRVKDACSSSHECCDGGCIVEPSSNDILCGKDYSIYQHEGNHKFRRTIKENLEEYVHAPSRTARSALVRSIYAELVKNGCRFLRKLETGCKKHSALWCEINPIQAKDKVGHAFRDRVPRVDGTKAVRVKRKKKKTLKSRRPKQGSASSARTNDQQRSQTKTKRIKTRSYVKRTVSTRSRSLLSIPTEVLSSQEIKKGSSRMERAKNKNKRDPSSSRTIPDQRPTTRSQSRKVHAEDEHRCYNRPERVKSSSQQESPLSMPALVSVTSNDCEKVVSTDIGQQANCINVVAAAPEGASADAQACASRNVAPHARKEQMYDVITPKCSIFSTNAKVVADDDKADIVSFSSSKNVDGFDLFSGPPSKPMILANAGVGSHMDTQESRFSSCYPVPRSAASFDFSPPPQRQTRKELEASMEFKLPSHILQELLHDDPDHHYGESAPTLEFFDEEMHHRFRDDGDYSSSIDETLSTIFDSDQLNSSEDDDGDPYALPTEQLFDS